MAKVYIGIPTLNRKHLVRETVKSLINQTFTDFYVRISDNHSSQEQSDSVEQFVSELEDDRFHFFRQPFNCGEYGQGRYFFKESEGFDFFMILHDDDVLNPNYLEKAMQSLLDNTDMAFFVANPFLMDQGGTVSRPDTDEYLREHGRLEQSAGEIDVLTTHLATGFTPISGTLFRRQALADSGYVDPECSGNFPFEANIFMRLGEKGARAWYEPEELLGFRFHKESLRNYLSLMDNPKVVDTMIHLFSTRTFEGANERRRKVVLSRLYRAKSLIQLRNGSLSESRDYISKAVRENSKSIKAWLVLPAVYLAPGLFKRFLPKLPEQREAPLLSKESK